MRIQIACVALLGIAVSASAELAIIQPPPHLGKDAYVSPDQPNGRDNDVLLVGGETPNLAFFKFDTVGLPVEASDVYLQLYATESDGVPMEGHLLLSPWNEPPSWGDPVSGHSVGILPAPPSNGYYTLGITNIYNSWQNGSLVNEGVLFGPTTTAFSSTSFRSSDIPSGSRLQRPRLLIFYEPLATAPQLKLPLPGGRAWMVTTETGGTDCASVGNPPVSSHVGLNYFSIDFGSSALVNGNVIQQANVPVYAAAAGRVIVAQFSQENGYYVVIDHDFDGSVETGLQTRYLHFAQPPMVAAGTDVSQGDRLGIMGSTGTGTGVHLHFGVRYRDSGRSSVPELALVEMEGGLLKEYVTDCTSSGSRLFFYTSTNTQ